MSEIPQESWTSLAAPLAVATLGRWLQGIPRGAPRVLYLHRQLQPATERALVRLIACAQREAAAGTVEGRVLIDTFGQLLIAELLSEEKRLSIVEIALELCEHGVVNLLQPSAEEVATRIEPVKGSLAAEGETLGRRKQLARSAGGDLLDKLLSDTHPDVIQNALMNPRVSEPLAVRLASRRPVARAVLDVVARSRFRTSGSVRRALVCNPYCDPQLACQLLSGLTRVELLQVAHDELLANEVREAARLMIEVKPPRHLRDRG